MMMMMSAQNFHVYSFIDAKRSDGGIRKLWHIVGRARLPTPSHHDGDGDRGRPLLGVAATGAQALCPARISQQTMVNLPYPLHPTLM